MTSTLDQSEVKWLPVGRGQSPITRRCRELPTRRSSTLRVLANVSQPRQFPTSINIQKRTSSTSGNKDRMTDKIIELQSFYSSRNQQSLMSRMMRAGALKCDHQQSAALLKFLKPADGA